MLQCSRQDVQWVISDNCSDDELYDFVEKINDSRVLLVRPKTRLRVGEHLDFAYRFATGEWQSHLGDDDIIFDSRFSILDKVIEKNPDADLIRGELARYYWHDFSVAKLANTLSPAKSYTGGICAINGEEYGRKLLNTKQIYGGGSWVVRKEIVSKVRGKFGYFSPFHTVEFFSARVSAFYSRSVVEVDFPIWIAGRHSGSVGSQALMGEDKVKSTDWDWDFEKPDPHVYCKYNYNGYVPISLDASLQVVQKLESSFDKLLIDEVYWAECILIETERLIQEKKLPPSYRAERNSIIYQQVGFHAGLKLKSLLYRIYNNLPEFLKKSYIRYRSKSKQLDRYLFGWSDNESAKKIYGVDNIMELSSAINRENCDQINKIKKSVIS